MKNIFLAAAFALVTLTGCAQFGESLLPTHDKVLTYALPYDLTYLRTLEALDQVPGWDLLGTEKEKGIIEVFNTNYSRLNDADKRMVKVLVSRVGRKETSVQLAPESQRVMGGDQLLNKIDHLVSLEVQ